ncbi:iron-containing alcohol dehydrogenase [Neorhizobium sp. JUb45]|uniref:iron-containing alcohol dehydrogenase n=1 Tax=unclassified Neorhizobium TaxID=2629175 RepID=UPI0010D82B0E|nr:iron-containing alcohol dehydrogenase [Neorhizobium sp. JUb45]TCR01177.1 alcohol dehydrogenase class IV [Neorhizobium sp. JUb45]
MFSNSFIPDMRFGAGSFSETAAAAAVLGDIDRALVVMDSFLAASGLANRLIDDLRAHGITAALFADFAGEPKLPHLQAATRAAKGAQQVIGVGGGSAMDIAKITACCAASGQDPMFYALAANPLPKNPLRKILVPTTAGTGAEMSATSIFAGDEGKKLWIWGPETKADLVILDPALTVSLPPHLTAWCGMDAFIHAFEAATNRNTHAGVQLYAYEAMRLVAGALETAVKAPGNLDARGKVLLGSCYAGIAVDNCGTAIAHNISHALAGLAPIRHGLATALGFEATLPWLVAAPTAELDAAAKAIGLASAQELPGFTSDLMDRCDIRRALPVAFDAVSPDELANEMGAMENRPMRRATARDVVDGDLVRFAEVIMSLPKTA